MTDGRREAPEVPVPVARDPAVTEGAGPVWALGDEVLVASLRAGDERAFAEVVDAWSRAMLHVARAYVSTLDSAQEVVQDTWLAVIRGVDRFEGRSSLRTWAFRILVNTAKTRGVRESRTLPFASLTTFDEEGHTVDPSRFRGAADGWPGHWAEHGRPQPFEPSPETFALAGEVWREIADAIATLPDRQRTVLVMRDVQGFSSEEVCDLLEISQENQRVLLHRGRAKVRTLLENHYRAMDTVTT